MQGLGATHVELIKHKYTGITGPIADTFGNLPAAFNAVIYGGNGNGKTEFYFRIIKELQKYGKVDVFSYEQGHGPDIQETIRRHRVKEEKWDVMFYDPFKKRDNKLTLFQELYNHLLKPKSAQFVVIDSIDACEFTPEEYRQLYIRFRGKKGFIWLSFEGNNKKPKTVLARNIGGEGDYILRVKDFIATVEKSRHKGWKDYIIWEEKARERNPLYFEVQEAEQKKLQKVTKAKKMKA